MARQRKRKGMLPYDRDWVRLGDVDGWFVCVRPSDNGWTSVKVGHIGPTVGRANLHLGWNHDQQRFADNSSMGVLGDRTMDRIREEIEQWMR